jgi:GMP synthase-like glutamine amidotransferase
MRFLVLQNDSAVPPGNLAVAASHFGHGLDVVRLFDQEVIPDVVDHDGIVLLGGGMGSYDQDAHPYLIAEKSFVADAVGSGVSVLGICLGCQILADALGGRAYHSGAPEAEFTTAQSTVSGDAAMDAYTSGRVLAFHKDTFDVPAGATITAVSAMYVQAFRFDSALAVQGHPDLTYETLLHWLEYPEVGDMFAQAGVESSLVVAQFADATDEVAELALAFFGAWFAEVQHRNSQPLRN